MRLWEPRENAPEWLKGNLSVHLETFTEWAQQHLDAKGFVRLDLKEGRDGTLYLALNTYRAGPKPIEPATEEDVGSSIPF